MNAPKPYDPVMREQGLNAVKLCGTRAELRTLWKLFKDEAVREAAEEKASSLPQDEVARARARQGSEWPQGGSERSEDGTHAEPDGVIAGTPK